MKKTLILLAIAVLMVMPMKAQQCEVKFDLNYDTTEQVESISVQQGCALPLDKKPMPQREGYRFGGWYTSKEGKAQDEWLFGKMVGMMGAFMAQANDSMKVEQPMTLYARWIAPTHIKDAEGLNCMRDDLYGWYVLDNDIDMSGMDDWIQVGVYEVDYEWAEGEWWKNSFKGKLDGQGHTIRNLKFTQPTSEKKAMFGSMMNGEICNLVIEDCVVDMNTTSMYVAPLVGIMKQGGDHVNAITNVQVKNAKYKVNLNNTQGAFSAVTFLTAGAWNGSISHCSVQGEMDITFQGTGGGQFYVGAFAGENYSEMDDCQSDVKINIHFAAPEPAKDFSVFVGGLAASATNVKNCVAKGSITIDGDPLTEQFFVGGLIGSERYGEVSHNKAQMQINLSGMKKAQTGGIVGEFNKTFGGVGAALGFKKTSVHDCQAEVEVNAAPSIQLTQGHIAGGGQPEPLNAWGGQMEYEISNCTW